MALVDVVSAFRHLRALILGDVMLDTYLEGTASRLCQEGPVPVVTRTGEYHLPGGAANTAANVEALGAEALLVSVVGCDQSASLLRAALRRSQVSLDWLVSDPALDTLHKVRILADGQYVVRFDEGGIQQLAPLTEQHLLATLEAAYACCHLVIVSDYRYGVVSEAVIKQLERLQTRQPKVLLVDSKALGRFRSLPATVVTPNYLEARLCVSERLPNASHRAAPVEIEEARQVGEQLLDLLRCSAVVITLAEQGALLLDRQGLVRHLPASPAVRASEVGAGDSFATALALALAAGASLVEAGTIACEAAALAVAQRWTATVRQQELLQRVSLRACLEEPGSLAERERHSQAERARLAERLEKERLAGRRIVFTNGIFDLLHAGHVHFLRRAKALGDLLVVGVNSDRSVRRLKGEGRPINSEGDRLALVSALDMVDHALLFEEETPTELILALRPHLHVKGGDYLAEILPEAEAVRAVGGQVVILPLLPARSTSALIARIRGQENRAPTQAEAGHA
ncbi:D-glycero-beta-D-manno-heptose 1-phosphate adenylyltransferase [Thermogemmatispora sp.]|uniref:D-glycero-beta-D-manno-heptose 1-phosphate adenylyltransferase n=1 Tax=Thermogemmatispora sp. TaxID=1968838 RepID=UPI0035E418E2